MTITLTTFEMHILRAIHNLNSAGLEPPLSAFTGASLHTVQQLHTNEYLTTDAFDCYRLTAKAHELILSSRLEAK